ncbi:MAG: hypothetical protein ABIT16_06560 [Croceibacterium sp.]
MPRPAAALTGRLAGTGALLVFAGLVMASGLDRLSVASPALGRMIPNPLQAQSARSSAQLAIVQGNPAAAIAYARRGVTTDPINPASTSVLGEAYLLGGHAAEADQAFRVAARFGWREAATQLYWYQSAFRSGDMPRAVDRVDALLRTRKGMAGAEQVLAPLESTAAGRTALIHRMAERPLWLKDYMNIGTGEPALLDRRSEVLVELGQAGTMLGCDAVSPFVRTAVDVGARRQAERVWVAHCPGATATNGLSDGSFEHVDASNASPFDWRQQPSGDVSIRSVDKGGGNHAVQLQNNSPLTQLVLIQAVALEPGSYRVVAKVAPGRVSASLGCKRNPVQPSLSNGDLGAGGQVLTVPVCANLLLGLWVRPSPQPVEIDDLNVERVR